MLKPSDIPDDELITGIYFKSDNDILTEYLIELHKGNFEGHFIVKICSTPIVSNYINANNLINGCEIGLPYDEIGYLCEIDLFPKDFRLRFTDDIMLYYDEKKYYGSNHSTNSVTSLMECINYAIEYGLNISGITPY